MANMAMTSYRIEGPKETLEKINNAIVEAMKDRQSWTEYLVCKILDIPIDEDKICLGGFIAEKPSLGENLLEFYAEERWGLQDFNEVLEKKFPDIKVYWLVEEFDNEIYATNDKDGKYFPYRYTVDACLNNNYEYECFRTKSEMWKWFCNKTNGKITKEEDIENFLGETMDECEDYVAIHICDVVES